MHPEAPGIPAGCSRPWQRQYFEDVSATSGIFDTSSKSLGAAILDVDGNGWPISVANDTQPNKPIAIRRTGRSRRLAGGVAFNIEGKARAGMGIDAVYLRFADTQCGHHELRQRDDRPVSRQFARLYDDVAIVPALALSRNTLGFGCLFADFDLDGSLDLIVANGHIDDRAKHPWPCRLRTAAALSQRRKGRVQGCGSGRRRIAAPRRSRRRIWRLDRDESDILMTTNGGPARLFRNDQLAGNRSVRFRLTGTKSNRDAIGATVRISRRHFHPNVKTGPAISQSELPVTFGVAGAIG